MKKRLSVIALIGGLALMLAGGAALADPVRSSSNWWDDMHDSSIMQQMRDQMPPALQEKCDRMHEQMSQWFEQHPDATSGPASMMGGSGMMGGSTSGSGMMSF
jgi:hypothetical protein